MNIDRYTKTVLTVIAGCLLWMCAMGTGSPVAAQPSTLDMAPFKDVVQPVVIVGTGTMDRTGRIAVNFHGSGRDQRTDPTLKVELPYTVLKPLPASLSYTTASPIPVEISAVKKTGEWEPIRARVEDAPVRPRPGGGAPPR
jgi:hypothetical protein